MKLPALYQLADQHRELERLADTTDDLPPEVIRDTIEALEGAIEAKAVSVAAVVRNLELHAEMIRTASKQLAERAARAEKRADSLRHYLLFNLQAVGVFKVESPEFTVTVRNNPVTVRIADERAVPAEFLVQLPAPPPKVDKAQIKEALKAGRDVPGCWLEAGQRVEIRS